ncbi:acyltransferase family protein [Blastomonas sp.]|uniref:acyltransferase family protein n=1 Tax=Blastomonas sp. TaxID=1909299 RepID=UPI00391C038C
MNILSGISLAEAAATKANHLNLIRAIAATAVLLSHAWPISLGYNSVEPFQPLIGYTLGEIAVLVFFAISGFLISASYDRSRSPRRYVIARTARLIPGLFVSVVFVAFLIGPFVTSLGISRYLTHQGVYEFIIRNVTLIWPQFQLPGVFEDNPIPNIEGSIWTLAYEVACYVGVLGLGLLGFFDRHLVIKIALSSLIVCIVWFQILDIPVHARLHALINFSLPFVIGMAFYVWRKNILLSPLAAVIITTVAISLRNLPIYHALMSFALTYSIFTVAYMRSTVAEKYNLLGDYSYGIYIYAFPIQGLMVHLFGPLTPIENVALALPITIVLAIASWHWVEKPALALSKRF